MNEASRTRLATSLTRRRRKYRPTIQALEPRIALAIDLANVAGDTANPQLPGPYGVLEAGLQQIGGAGWSVAELGDTNGDGFDDFLIGAPTIASGSTSPTLGTGPGTAYLVFGSNEATLTGPMIANWLNLTSQQRIGDLGVLGNTSQTNPLNGMPGLNFNGLTFVAGSSLNAQLGASVSAAGDVNRDGLADFMIGAPSDPDSVGRDQPVRTRLPGLRVAHSVGPHEQDGGPGQHDRRQ